MSGNSPKRAILLLADGVVFEGYSLGAEGETIGEVVFNTSITGYQEILTDPSYKGQIVVFTYTQIGNYGINDEDIESKEGIKVEGLVVKESFDSPSNWRSKRSLSQYLKSHNIVGIQGIDTRALTRHLRDSGSQIGIISTEDLELESLFEKVRRHPGISSLDLVKDVTTQAPYRWVGGRGEGEASSKPKVLNLGLNPSSKKVVVYDFGVKFNILRNLIKVGLDVIVCPANTPAEEVLEMDPHGILLSNGPGDPNTVTYAIENTRKLLGKKPIFGICLGHQILGLAMGGMTYKLKFGHHGGNHPVKDLSTEKVEITAQNHNYCVDINSLKGQVRLTHKNLYDGTEEGMEHVELPIFSIQYHPEAGPGPNDSLYLFKRFKEMLG